MANGLECLVIRFSWALTWSIGERPGPEGKSQGLDESFVMNSHLSG